MPKLYKLLSLLITAFGLIAVPLAPAQAITQNARSWVASTGSDSNPCSRASPCLTFSGALAKTASGGEINCVDQGDFSNNSVFYIRQSLTIDCEGVVARMTGPSDGGATIAVLAPVEEAAVVVLRGLDISGNGVSQGGIQVYSAAAVHVEKCVVRDAFYGVTLESSVTPSSTTELYVSDTVVTNDTASGAAGIFVQPSVSNTINKVVLNRVEARNNYFGIKADGTSGSGGVINMTVRDSVVSGNTINGIVGTGNAGGPAILMMVDNSTSSHNGAGYGVIADGPKTVIEMSRSTASGSNFGIGASNGGQLISYQNNQVALNSTDGSPTGIASFK